MLGKVEAAILGGFPQNGSRAGPLGKDIQGHFSGPDICDFLEITL